MTSWSWATIAVLILLYTLLTIWAAVVGQWVWEKLIQDLWGKP